MLFIRTGPILSHGLMTVPCSPVIFKGGEREEQILSSQEEYVAALAAHSGVVV